MQRNQILDDLMSYVARELLDGQRRELEETTPLLEWGILDSIAMVDLLSHIEEEFGLEVPDEAVRPEHFATLGRLTDLIEKISPDQPEQEAHDR